MTDAERIIDAAAAAISVAASNLTAQAFALHDHATALQTLLQPPAPPPTYSVTASAATVAEGQSVTFDVRTTGVPSGTQIPYALIGGVNQGDIGVPLTGVVAIAQNGTATLIVPAVADMLTEGDELIEFVLGDGLARASVTVLDASQTPPPPQPTYTLTASGTVVKEGESVMITLRTTGLDAGAVVPYSMSGVDPADFVDAAPTHGAFTVDQAGTDRVALSARADALTEGDEILRVTLDQVDGVSVSVTIRDTSQTPPPTPPPDPTLGVLHSRTLNPSALILPRAHVSDMGTYERSQKLWIVTDGRFEVRVFSGATQRPWRSTPYRLLVDGVEHDERVIPPTTNVGVFYFDRLSLSHGRHQFEVLGEPDETCVPVFGFVDRGEGPVDRMIASLSSHDVSHHQQLTQHVWAWVPTGVTPTPAPLVPREYVPFSDPSKIDRLQCYITELVPGRTDDIYRPRRAKGIEHTANRQNYAIDYQLEELPNVAYLDGPRGVGCITGPTHLVLGESSDSIYVGESHRISRVQPDGHITTLLGLRSVYPAPSDGSASDHQLVGDWSAVPATERGLLDCWGFAWRFRSTRSDPDATPIPNDLAGNVLQQPHLGAGAQMLVANSMRNMVLRAQFSKERHNLPPVITVFARDLMDPWDCTFGEGGDDVLYVSERLGNRISMWDGATGAPLGNLIEGPANLSYAYLGPNRKAILRRSLAEVRAQRCVLPEGLAYRGGWLYFGSLATQQVCRVNVVTREYQVVVELPPLVVAYTGAQYHKIAVSDGTFAPEGAVFNQFWTSNSAPWGAAFTPDGKPWTCNSNGGQGPGKVWDGFQYGAVVAVGRNRLIFGTSLEGLWVIGRAKGEKTWLWDGPTGFNASRAEWRRRGLPLLHGDGGHGYYGMPLPWGVSSGVDAWLEMNGHVRG